MHCSEFRELHCVFVDDTLAGVELVRMQGHIAECEKCAALDSRVRRSLMLARNLPHIEPSPEFSARLEAKLRACRQEGIESPACANFRAVAAVGVVASVLMLGYVMTSSYKAPVTDKSRVTIPTVAKKGEDIVLSPVVAMAERPQPQIVAGSGRGAGMLGEGVRRRGDSDAEPAPEIIAAMSAGMPFWPAAVFAEQAPIHYAGYRKAVH